MLTTPQKRAPSLLLIGGAGQARVLSHLISEIPDLAVTLVLGTAPRDDRPYGLQVEVHDLTQKTVVETLVKRHEITHVLDVSHPYDTAVSSLFWTMLEGSHISFMQLVRPLWLQSPGDVWHYCDNVDELRDIVQPQKNIFVATGREMLHWFERFTDCSVFFRQIAHAEGTYPYENGQFLIGYPPFSIEEEIELFKAHDIDFLVTKNAGGVENATKLHAARALGIEVVLINRPDPLGAPTVSSVEAAMTWVTEEVLCNN
ncbi:MAG: precorrin-6A/cobalt-precorrin-6A reductase [Halocynthiibacter sp.]